MWFASKKGLYRYDGYNIISYKNNPLNPNSLASNSLESICIDSIGILWIGTFGSGLDRFDPATEKFTHFHYDPKNNASLSNDTVFTILRIARACYGSVLLKDWTVLTPRNREVYTLPPRGQ